MLKAYWAYNFKCGRSMEAILGAFNEAGPWRWVLRDSAVYGDYLNCRPQEHVRLQVHDRIPFYCGSCDIGFSALLEIRPEGKATRSEIDDVFWRLLQAIDATNITETDAYD